MSSVLEQLHQRAAVNPEVIVLDDGEMRMSAAQLFAAVTAIRDWFRRSGVSVVALVGDNSIPWIVADLALLGLPVRVVPVPGFFSVSQVRHVCREAEVDAVVGTLSDVQSFPVLNPAQLAQPDAGVDIVAGLMPQASRYVGEYEKVTFTSGSTGSPKGVRLSLATLESTAQSIAHTLAETCIESHLCVLPYATLLENVAGIYAPLLQGVTVHVRRLAQLGLQSPAHFNPLLFAKALQDIKPHATILVPQLLLALLTLMQRGILTQHAFRFIAVGGGKVSSQLLQMADQLQLPVFEGYGLSECGSVIALNTPQARRIGSVGKILPHAQVRVSDEGELMVKGAVMKGYLGEPESDNAEVATGDLGAVDGDGFVTVSGRRKSLFITAFGRNVNPEWVEAELLCQLPIQQVAVFGEAMAINVAVVVPRAGFDYRAVTDAVAVCNATLPDYARVGRVVMAQEPFTDSNGLATPNGRIRRFAIAQQYAGFINQEVEHGILSTIATTN